MLLSSARLYQALEIGHNRRKAHRLVKETHAVSRRPSVRIEAHGLIHAGYPNPIQAAATNGYGYLDSPVGREFPLSPHWPI